MGWAVGYDQDHDRFRGYGVPAYCDATGCGAEIDRGVGYACQGHECDIAGDGTLRADREWPCSDLDAVDVTIFVCGNHTCRDVDEANLPPEHPDWVRHLLTDSSWQQWRDEHPEKVAALRANPDPDAALRAGLAGWGAEG